MKKKILLINPNFPKPSTVLNIPMGLMCIGSYLAHHGYNVHIMDANNYNSHKRLEESLRKNAPGSLCVGFSVMSAQVPHALSLSRWLRTNYPALPIIWGGIHPTLYPRQTAESLMVDFVVKGEGEQSVLDLVRAIGEQGRFEKIRGIAYTDPVTGSVRENPESDCVAMDDLPRVNWQLLEDIAQIGDLAEVERRTLTGLPFQTSRGCPHRCTFCVNSILAEGYRFRDIGLIIEELAILDQAGVKRINFIDEIFFFRKTRVISILDQFKNRKFSFQWFGSVRCDYFRPGYLNLELLKKARGCGCAIVGIGAESGSEKILTYLKKDIKVADILNTAHLLHQAQIKANFSFMIGLPSEGLEDVRKTMRIIARITAMDRNFKILGPQIYRPYPGSLLYRSCLAAGMREPSSLTEWAESPYIRPGSSALTRALYPWVTFGLHKLENMVFYATLAGKNSRFALVTWLVRRLAEARCKSFCFIFPFEKILYKTFLRLGLNRILRNRSIQ